MTLKIISQSEETPSPGEASELPQPFRAWWKDATVYQIYPSSFNDTNGDGIGDLRGVIEKLDYLEKLNVDVVWLSPIYKSPQKDMGYDISDYRDIDPRYGTLADVDELVKGLHERGMKLVMDLVVNHTSDEHAWFEESRSSRNNSKKDWYIWKEPRIDSHGKRHPPNNWASVFEGSAWTYDETRRQYYLHLFLPGQPDLNWEYPPVREAVYSLMRFWLDKKIDGFRMDVINLISKVQTFPDAPITIPREKYQSGMKYCAAGPRMHEFLHEMRINVLDKYDTITVGEMPWVSNPDEVLKVIGRGRRELDMIFQFDIVSLDSGDHGKYSPRVWHLQDLREVVTKWQNYMIHNGGWNSLFDENHDQPRSVSRYVDRGATDASYETRALAAKLLATFLTLQSGTVYIFQGQELGMRNCPKDWGIEEYKDIETINVWNKILKERGDGADMSDVMEQIQQKARDNSRMPVQWDSSKNGGFTTGEPWMRVHDEYPSWNASLQTGDPSSIYSYWSNLFKFRKKHLNTVVYGDFEMLTKEDEAVLAYRREGYSGNEEGSDEREDLVVVLNFQPTESKWNLADGGFTKKSTDYRVLLGNYKEELNIKGGVLTLRPFEAVVFSGNGA